ncbi:hypothetical protein M422DRAFT_34939 [Sphaerobolus stellatus SS14]|uniref:C2H2-type domain-containing protein n=1 Tax=Sphaerobolus stellatus (strain SS14) TaxID=990650 RepID=A0A0C9VC13_SPHS4|nr:hypothetical protein M422DRAFT_34939 [Sphaerobolus stellatus SS14]
MSSAKRARSRSPTPEMTKPEPEPSHKLSKLAVPPSLYASLTCRLPPTCSLPHKPTRLSSVQQVEEHYSKYHTFVCEAQGCRTVFPDGRFLELHIAECHDPIIALKRERGDKTFACYLASCDRSFTTPKGRRLHLIQVHGYPKQFFFSVTNKGIGGLLHRWGPGASLYRGEWKPRSKDEEMGSASESDSNEGEMDEDGRERPPFSGNAINDSPEPAAARAASSEVDSLSGAISSLSLVPDKIRFGRGGKKGGFSHFQHAPIKAATKRNTEQTNGEAEGKSHNGSRHNHRGRVPRKHGVSSQEASSASGDAEMGNVS